MTRKDQKRIINELVKGIKEETQKNLHRIPEDWDGVELRYWITDIAHSFLPPDDRYKTRKRRYQNACAVYGL